MDYQTKEKFLNLVKQVNDELADDNMKVFVACTPDGAKMMEGIIDWECDLDKLDGMPFIAGHFKATEIPVVISKSVTVGMYDFNIYIRMIPKAEFTFEHYKYPEVISNEQASEEKTVEESVN